ncbi:hypothetical protein N5F23_13195 [Pseudomonas sichuanensis]|uniref:hypothetical protein n=1 Tax=Pseudomonas sichuanensis TaxID=2213015 RepID=UPI00244898B0|nr:hypothetical protein [Pseudomonas sichuanensis]MDH0729118.1 hypothetical protein [Pseudomonas sichuanensis]MDH1583542.1 hypothetical protein [Pseudomonas sichuanensis]MDH1595243.1 hypothetical protein [Pseudomonas sichuanensis]MDH1596153.1 hypothetical protein [Pseudomonas sichuanensis]
MLDLIHIVDEHLSPRNQQNFTMPGRDPVAPQASLGAAVTTATLASLGSFTLSSLSLPTPLLVAALINTPGLTTLFNKDPASNSGTDPAESKKAEMLAAYVKQHSKSPSEAKENGYRFQPGHPVVGKTYRKHPLNDYSRGQNGSLYIPSDSYDSILLEERESELIKLLVHLGATRITITKKASDKTTSAVSASVSAQVGPTGGGGINYQGNTEKVNDSFDTREFVLAGRRWEVGSAVATENFFWLAYEPSWKAVVFAREQGGCLSASLEIKESTSFSTDKNLEMSVRAKVVEAKAEAGLKTTGNEEKTYYVKAEFAPIAQ